MLDKKSNLPDEAVVIDDRVSEAYTRIEIEIVHRQRLLEDVPKSLLRVGDKQVGIERQFALGEPLADTQLKFYVGIAARRFLSQSGTPDKIIVLKKREIGSFVEFGPHAVGVVFGYVAAYLGTDRKGQK